jgi:hypothetical protein
MTMERDCNYRLTAARRPSLARDDHTTKNDEAMLARNAPLSGTHSSLGIFLF